MAVGLRGGVGAALLLLPGLCGCAFWSAPPQLQSATAPGLRTVYVVQRGYHTDIGFYAGDLSGPLMAVAANLPNAQTILVGFGERSFVTPRRRGLGEWLLAVLPGRGAMLVSGLRTAPDAAFGLASVVRLRLDESQFEGVEAFVNASFTVTHEAPVGIGDGLYASVHTYDLLDTCNTWTAAALRSGGLAAPVAFTLFSEQAMRGARHVAGQT